MVKVYYSDIFNLPLDTDLSDFCDLRREYVNSFTSKNRKKQSVYVWKLLIKTLDNYGLNAVKFNNSCGKWSLDGDELYFSLSHSNNIVCVAISDYPVGVDVEMCDKKTLRISKKFFNLNDNNELLPHEEIDKYTVLWTKKESEYKNQNLGNNSTFSYEFIKDSQEKVYVIGLSSTQKISLEKILLG